MIEKIKNNRQSIAGITFFILFVVNILFLIIPLSIKYEGTFSGQIDGVSTKISLKDDHFVYDCTPYYYQDGRYAYTTSVRQYDIHSVGVVLLDNGSGFMVDSVFCIKTMDGKDVLYNQSAIILEAFMIILSIVSIVIACKKTKVKPRRTED